MTHIHPEHQYLDLLGDLVARGSVQHDRTGVGTRALFGRQMRFDLSQGFPLLTTKKLHIKSIVGELLWFLTGSTNNNDLKELGVSIWNEWAREDGDLGPVYGKQWRAWETPDGRQIDQISDLIAIIRKDPGSRRQIVTAWNPADNPKMVLTPCHCLWQTFVADGRLSLQLYQRSADSFLGLPFNIASYALLTHMLAQQCGLEPGEFVWTGGDVHLYLNHIEQAKLQVTREPKAMPRLVIARKPDSIFDYRMEDFSIVDYDAHPHIKAPIAV